MYNIYIITYTYILFIHNVLYNCSCFGITKSYENIICTYCMYVETHFIIANNLPVF